MERMQVVRTLIENRCSMAPILSSDPPPGSHPLPGNAACGRAGDPPAVLHVTSLSGVLASLMRHFRASLASLPLLAQPLASMPLGSWSPDSPIGRQGQALSPGVRTPTLCVTLVFEHTSGPPITAALRSVLVIDMLIPHYRNRTSYPQQHLLCFHVFHDSKGRRTGQATLEHFLGFQGQQYTVCSWPVDSQ